MNRPGRRREDDTNIVVNCIDAHMGGGGPDDNAAQAGHFIATTLRGEGFDASEDGTGRGTPIVPVAFAQNQIGEVRVGAVVNTLNTNSNASGRNTAMISANYGVRRLMPIECERLQGLPDGWTEYGIDDNGERVAMSDSARYRMIGNGVAVPNVRWIAKRTVRI